jgi:hypothetical protein
MTSDSAEADALALLVIRLHSKNPSIPVAAVDQIVTETYASYHDSRIREFIWLLVERESRDRLRALPCPAVSTDAHVGVGPAAPP